MLSEEDWGFTYFLCSQCILSGCMMTHNYTKVIAPLMYTDITVYMRRPLVLHVFMWSPLIVYSCWKTLEVCCCGHCHSGNALEAYSQRLCCFCPLHQHALSVFHWQGVPEDTTGARGQWQWGRDPSDRATCHRSTLMIHHSQTQLSARGSRPKNGKALKIWWSDIELLLFLTQWQYFFLLKHSFCHHSQY